VEIVFRSYLFETVIAGTILARAHVRARKQAEHMGASDLINAAAKYLARTERSQMANVG
jgi:hypothetical protein